MSANITGLLREHGIKVQADEDEFPEHPHRGGKVVKLTQDLVDSAVKELEIKDLAEYLRGREIVPQHKLSSEFNATKAAGIFIEVLEAVDPAWQKKQAVVHHGDQVVVVERPEAEVAQHLHQALEHARAEKAHKEPKAAKAPKAPKAVKEPAAEPAEKPKRAPRKPKVKE